VAGFIARRLFYGFLVLLGVVVTVFFIFNILPADPARLVLGQRADIASIEVVNRELGRDKPLFTQFLIYLNDLSPISVHNNDTESPLYFSDRKYSPASKLFMISEKSFAVIKIPYLRRSYQSKRNVSEVLLEALPGTVILAITSMLLATFLGILLGIVSAIKKDRPADNLILFCSSLGTSVPSFFAGILIAWIFGFVLHRFTGLNMTGSLYDIDPFEGEMLNLRNLVLPTLALGIRPLSIVVQLTRSSMLDVLARDYIRTAAAKGLSFKRIIFGHALKNALNPVVTAISGWFASLMAGAFFVEYIFGWRGIGKITVEALEKYDFPVVMGAVLLVAVFFIIINIIVDILYGLLDPRVRVQ
jgi:peptide/nickel transport system permease protein